ncbi:hypothetical protein V8G54_022255 [Vigna mungo]|uniref:Transmembrane protein n=1 Tax=Vigna mungo TaxID=3915 RepID=A0AAQ3NEV4_VIGMU
MGDRSAYGEGWWVFWAPPDHQIDDLRPRILKEKVEIEGGVEVESYGGEEVDDDGLEVETNGREEVDGGVEVDKDGGLEVETNASSSHCFCVSGLLNLQGFYDLGSDYVCLWFVAGVSWVSRCRDWDFLVLIWVVIFGLQGLIFGFLLFFSASNRRFVLMMVTAAWWPEGLVVAHFVLRQR